MEYPFTNLHLNSNASFFEGSRFQNTIVDRYSVIASGAVDTDGIPKYLSETWMLRYFRFCYLTVYFKRKDHSDDMENYTATE